MLLIDDLLLSPLAGFKFILRTLARVAEEQYSNGAHLKEALLELQLRLESGEIDEEQYVQEEAQIMRELREIQRRKREPAGLSPEDATGLSGRVQKGSRAERSHRRRNPSDKPG
jgi:Gas vesicle protein G